MIKVFIGYDPRQPVAAQVAMHSIYTHASAPVAMTPLVLKNLPITRIGLTQFTYARFLSPWLCHFEGISIFVDSDILCLGDVCELAAYPLAYPETAVFVVPHRKAFERPSVMVFNNARCSILSPEYVENPAHQLLNLSWAQSVGSLAPEWNHLVGYDEPNVNVKLLHFTQGIPCWAETKDCEGAALWTNALMHANSTVSFQDLMGRSVHVPHMKLVKA